MKVNTIDSSLPLRALLSLSLASAFLLANTEVLSASPNTDDRVDIGQAEQRKNEGGGYSNNPAMDQRSPSRDRNPAENQHPPGTPVPNPSKPTPLDHQNSRPLPGGGNMNDAGQAPVHPVGPSGSNPGSAY